MSLCRLFIALPLLILQGNPADDFEAALQRFTSAMKEKDEEALLAAIRLLGRFKDRKECTLALAKVLEASEKVVQAAAHTLGEAKDPASVPRLLSALASPANKKRPEAKASIITALGAIAHPTALDTLLKLSRDKEIKISQASIAALGNYSVKKRTIIDHLVRELESLSAAFNDVMQKKKQERFRSLEPSITQALLKLTGQNFNGNPVLARKWFNENKKKIKDSAEKPPEDSLP